MHQETPGQYSEIKIMAILSDYIIQNPVANLAGLQAINTTILNDNILVMVKSLGLFRLDLASSASADNVNIVQPTTGSGRWLRITDITLPLPASSGGTGQNTTIIKPPSLAITLTNLNATYNNGTSGVGATLTNAGTLQAFQVGIIAFTNGQQVTVAGQTNQAQNGPYIVTNNGSPSVAWVLTRPSWYNGSTNGAIQYGDIHPVLQSNSSNANVFNLYYMSTQSAVTVGTTNLTFTALQQTDNSTIQFNASGQLSVIQAGIFPAPNVENTNARTLGLIDAYAQINFTNSSGCALTIPNNSSVAMPVGTRVRCYALGNSSGGSIVSLVLASGVTLLSQGGSTITNAAVDYGGNFELQQVQTNLWTLVYIYEEYNFNCTFTWGGYATSPQSVLIIRKNRMCFVNTSTINFTPGTSENASVTSTALPVRFVPNKIIASDAEMILNSGSITYCRAIVRNDTSQINLQTQTAGSISATTLTVNPFTLDYSL
jgi:hypothetical protein